MSRLQEAKARPNVRWSDLEREAFSVIQQLLDEWNLLIARTDGRAEAACHRFLARNAGIFLRPMQNFPAVISKLRLGAEFVTDLVIVENCYSNGAKYHLYELESPADSLFTKKGTASQALLTAIHQVIGWKSWVAAHRGEARRIFPTLMHGYDADAIFSYTIIIGRRLPPDLLERRRELSTNLGIDIRSFDSLTSGIQHRDFNDTLDPMSGDCDDRLSPEERSELVNPFHRAFTDPEWRELVHRVWDVGHFYHAGGAKYLALARSSPHLAEFRRWASKFGDLSRAPRTHSIAAKHRRRSRAL